MRKARASVGASVVTALSMVASAVVMAWAADDNGKVAAGRRAD
jgi:hypothetical protein